MLKNNEILIGKHNIVLSHDCISEILSELHVHVNAKRIQISKEPTLTRSQVDAE